MAELHSNKQASSSAPYATPIDDEDQEQPFRLLDLPDELWVKIGKMVIDDWRPIKLTTPADFDLLKRVPAVIMDPPPILHTCSALRNELRLYYYSSDKFKVGVSRSGLMWRSAQDLVGRYLVAIGPEARRQLRGYYIKDSILSPTTRTPQEPSQTWKSCGIGMAFVPERKSHTGDRSTSSPGDAASLVSKVTPRAIEVQPFRLFDLPDELWVRIGKMVIHDTKAINVGRITLCSDKKGCDAGHEAEEWLVPSCKLTPPAILQTCSWLRNELRGTYYRDKVAVRVVWEWAPYPEIYSLLGRYLRMIGPKARSQIQGAMSDDIWLVPKRPTPEPQWCRYVDWEIEMMLEAQRTIHPSSEPGHEMHELWYKIKFL
ncbi:hypothetical protein TI39_contig4271g00002 [Zymoseptoria brevis]|uniref:F-box domain-containing protein n=1 Tax=Zymoseptoria brevis TaxID=1047168 RepID=A0A0F4GBW7_9PEZI|nr:hypothetical protein TI39_contig4271g00002 [Zymoseptoria brevis]